MSTNCRRAVYTNISAQSWVSEGSISTKVTKNIANFHSSLPGFAPTRLVSLDAVAKEIGVKNVYLKDESNRWGLPSFKILGASWAVHQAIVQECNLPENVGLDDLGDGARKKSIELVAATDGNHGRAVAKMARVLGIGAAIYVPREIDRQTRDFITSEGAKLIVVDGDYDFAVHTAAHAAQTTGGLLIQDTAFERYENIPKWIVDGYTTMLREIDNELGTTSPKIFVVPVGVGSLAQAVVLHNKTEGRSSTILAVEPDSAACLWESLQAGLPTSIETRSTIMSGMNCGTVSTVAWPILKLGIDACVTISDEDTHEAVLDLESVGVCAGPCGAATLAAIRYIDKTHPEALHLSTDSIVVLICSERARVYIPPLKAATEFASA